MDLIKAALLRAIKDTAAPLGLNWITILLGVGLIASAALDVYLRGWFRAVDEISTNIIYSLIPTAIVIGFFLYNLAAAPFRIYREQREEIESHKAKYDPIVSEKLKALYTSSRQYLQEQKISPSTYTGTGRLTKRMADELNDLIEVGNEWYKQTYSEINDLTPDLIWIFVNADKDPAAKAPLLGFDAKLKALGEIIIKYDERKLK